MDLLFGWAPRLADGEAVEMIGGRTVQHAYPTSFPRLSLCYLVRMLSASLVSIYVSGLSYCNYYPVVKL